MLTTFVNALLSADADAVSGAAYGTASPERVNRSNGYRHRDFDARPARCRDLEAAAGLILPGLAAPAVATCRGRPDQRGGELLPLRMEKLVQAVYVRGRVR